MNTPRNQVEPTVWHVGGDDVYQRVPLLLELRKRGFTIGAVGSQDHPLFAESEIPFFHYPLQRRANPVADMKARHALVKLFREHAPDVVHAFDTRPAILAPLAANAANVPGRIRTITGMGRVFSSTSLTSKMARLAYRTIQRHVGQHCITVFQNQDDQQYFRANQLVSEGQEALVAGSGIDIEHFQQQAANLERTQRFRSEVQLEGKHVVTMIARLIPEKGVREFLQAASSVGNRQPGVRFLLVGPLSTEGRCPITEEEIRSHAPTVHYLGERGDIPTILSATDIFVLPSYYREGVPRVLLEAGALCIPLITTNAPGCRDVVRDEVEGLIVPPRDWLVLSKAIERLLNCAEARQQFGEAAQRRVVKNFSLDQVADAYAEIYRASLATSNGQCLRSAA